MHKRQSGFTIVELLIVVVVIGILAAITLVAYNGLQTRARDSMLTTQLSGAAKLMEISNVENGAYPSALPSGINPPPDVGMSLANTGVQNTYCINAHINKGGTMTRMYFNSSTAQIQQGTCSGSVIYGSEIGVMPSNLVVYPDFNSSWTMSLSVASAALTTRPGTASDPYPTKPVLIWTNNVARTTSWAVLSSSVQYSQIFAGKTYEMTYWVRKTGTGYSGTSNVFGVMDGSATNRAIDLGTNYAVNSTWTRVNGTKVAAQNALSSNRSYVGLSPTYFATTGWTLEFQGFELYER